MSYPQQILKLNSMVNAAKAYYCSFYSDSSDKWCLWQMRTLVDVANESRWMIDNGRGDGIKNFSDYCLEIGLDVNYGAIVEVKYNG